MNKKYLDETDARKVNLTIGAYRTEEGKNWVLPVVHEAEVKLANDPTLDHEYLPVLGLEKFTRAATELVLGSDSVAIKEGRAFGVQCLSGKYWNGILKNLLIFKELGHCVPEPTFCIACLGWIQFMFLHLLGEITTFFSTMQVTKIFDLTVIGMQVIVELISTVSVKIWSKLLKSKNFPIFK